MCDGWRKGGERLGRDHVDALGPSKLRQVFTGAPPPDELMRFFAHLLAHSFEACEAFDEFETTCSRNRPQDLRSDRISFRLVKVVRVDPQFIANCINNRFRVALGRHRLESPKASIHTFTLAKTGRWFNAPAYRIASRPSLTESRLD